MYASCPMHNLKTISYFSVKSSARQMCQGQTCFFLLIGFEIWEVNNSEICVLQKNIFEVKNTKKQKYLDTLKFMAFCILLLFALKRGN
jgi:hypothetical protein